VCCASSCGREFCYANYFNYGDVQLRRCSPLQGCDEGGFNCLPAGGSCDPHFAARAGLCRGATPRPTPTRTPVITDNPCGCPFIYVGEDPICTVPPTRVDLGCKPAPNDICADCCDFGWTCTWTCPGDCNGNRRVGVEELTRAVNIFLGAQRLTACRNADANRDETLTINELIRAVTRALDGCE